ncbi:hypothetical protein KQI86_08220 [Clostridium sp. MSJ-11]|uniref:Uncharacterized protein n=1 Tax=Clostridium mobile TaxID=2841512 RepID=A0ABS6EGG8_9CLOT|nr:hypothetical protein [Clostridium mobile]MBU5484311.1 hypothetical protein [Clostridium mobile]
MYKIIKKANNGWEVHEVVGIDTISLVKYSANHHDINKLIEALRLLYKNKVVEGSIDMNLAMQDEYLQDLSIGANQFIINLDFWQTFVFYPKQKEGNSYVMKVFNKLATDTN